MPTYSVETIEAMQKHLLSYRDNLRVEVEPGIPVVAKTVSELRALSTWPGHLVLDVHIDRDPQFSVVRVARRGSWSDMPGTGFPMSGQQFIV